MYFFEFLGRLLFHEKFSRHELATLPRVTRKISHLSTFSLWDYQSKQVKDLIRHMKNHRAYFLARHIGDFLYQEVITIIAEENMLSYFEHPLVIPIPINKKRMQERGFNQTHIYTKYLAKKLGAQYQPNILKRKNSKQKQALVNNREARFENVKNCFYIPPRQATYITGKDIILVDDLTTTEATLGEARKTLERAGARKIISITLAH